MPKSGLFGGHPDGNCSIRSHLCLQDEFFGEKSTLALSGHYVYQLLLLMLGLADGTVVHGQTIFFLPSTSILVGDTR